MLPYMCALADYAAEVRNSEGYETDRTTDRHSAGNKEHYGNQLQCLMHIGELDLPVIMPGQRFCSNKSRGQSDSKKSKRKYDIHRCHSLKIEVRSAPEVILLEQVTVRGVRHYDRSEGSYECTEENAECNKVAGTYLQGYEKAHQSTQKRTYETSHSQGTPSGHSRSSRTKAGRTSQTQTVDIP